MEKRSPVDHPIHDLLARRWSPRAFDAKPVETQKLLSVLEAMRWSPSSSNEQPWRLVLATKQNPAEFEAMLSCLVEGNQKWAKNAPVLFIAIGAKKFARNDTPNRHHLHDVGLALSMLAIEAVAQGLVTHYMAGFEVAKARQVLQVPEDYEPITAGVIGYVADVSTLPPDLAERENAPRKRKTLTEFVYTGKFGQVADFLKK
jgi:nitroreductase